VAKSRVERLKSLVGRRISEIRRSQGLPQEQLAVRLGVSVQWTSRVERGLENLKLETVATLAHALGVEAVEFFTDAEADPDLPARVPRRDLRKKRRPK
jgi:transcriptional regulator with XRE-family HTH domain